MRLLIVLPPPLPSCATPHSVSNLSEDSYDYVFGGRRKTPPATTSTTQIKLTSAPVRLRPEGELSSLYILYMIYNYVYLFLDRRLSRWEYKQRPFLSSFLQLCPEATASPESRWSWPRVKIEMSWRGWGHTAPIAARVCSFSWTKKKTLTLSRGQSCRPNEHIMNTSCNSNNSNKLLFFLQCSWAHYASFNLHAAKCPP